MTDLATLLQLLVKHNIDFIIIGGGSATTHGSARLTEDLDVVYGRTPENMARLAACLAPYKPYLRGAPPGLPFQLDAATIQRGLNFTLTTELGALDLFGEIPEGGRYEDMLHFAGKMWVFVRRGLTQKNLSSFSYCAGPAPNALNELMMTP